MENKEELHPRAARSTRTGPGPANQKPMKTTESIRNHIRVAFKGGPVYPDRARASQPATDEQKHHIHGKQRRVASKGGPVYRTGPGPASQKLMNKNTTSMENKEELHPRAARSTRTGPGPASQKPMKTTESIRNHIRVAFKGGPVYRARASQPETDEQTHHIHGKQRRVASKGGPVYPA